MSIPNTDSKLILASGADSGIGTTSIMNYVAIELSKKGPVLLIEFKRKTGFSIYMNKGHHEKRRSLTEVLTVPERLPDNVIRSPHSGSMFYLCMNLYEDCLKLQEYQSFKIIDIIKESKRIFDYVILDLPADPTEPAVGVTFGKDFIYKPDHTLLFVDERVSSYKYLNDFNAILTVAGETNPRDVTFIMNKVATNHYHEYIEDYLPSLPLTKPTNKVWLPFLPDLIEATNMGRIYETGVNKESKLFFNQITEIADIIIEDKRGVNLTQNTMNRIKEEREGRGLIGKLFKKKVDTLETQEEKAEHNRKVDLALQEADDRLDFGINSDKDGKDKYKFVTETIENFDDGWEDMTLLKHQDKLDNTGEFPYELYENEEENKNTNTNNKKKKSKSLFSFKSKNKTKPPVKHKSNRTKRSNSKNKKRKKR